MVESAPQNMKPGCLIIALGLLCWMGCSSTKPYLSTNSIPSGAQILEILNHPETRFYYHTRKIPRCMLTRAKQVSEQTWTYDGVYHMANPGKKYRHGCSIERDFLGRRLPSRRLIFMARLHHYRVLCYERGGRGHNLLISFSEFKGQQMSYYNLGVEGIEPCTEYSNLEKIKQALQEENMHFHYSNGQEMEHPSVPF